MATIRDIAKLTGYSITTISRVINHHPYVAKEKRDEILAVMKELDYVPNRSAQNLSTGQTKNIGVLIPFTNHPYYDQLLLGLTKAAFEKGYRVTLLPTNYEAELEKQYLDEFAAKTFDGLIVTTRANTLDKFIPYLHEGRIIFCEESPDVSVGCVYTDLEGAIREMIASLQAKGLNKIGLTLGRSKRLSYNSRLILDLCEELIPDFSKEWIKWDCIHAAEGIEAARYFEKLGVEAVLSNGDEVGATILQHYKKQGKTPPLVIGRDNLLISEVLNFSTVNHHLVECGETAFRLFYEDSKEKIKLPYDLIWR
ncbi:LacI family DNA-binding transcriptional regulator [Vagococcus fessus]|uniref:LacI family transcriptional regulator n=1 Tax=Vagococcus fessus TaxID=120370 RepID=A0A430A7H0_9ENTE|nr:LacI family DNA-binding transcriptional regulator [Vagococcus fessus]RSU03035.1 LacI family transcriptional regulator [Vagococcus fessus]